MDQTKIFEANLDLTLHSQAVLELLSAYATDPMGNGEPLDKDVLTQLIPGLQNHPTTIIFLAFHESKAVGIVTCFKGFSTSMARQMIHISDFYVLPDYQEKKIGQKLLEIVEKKAVELNCCKITIEVPANNKKALQIYKMAGYTQVIPEKEAKPTLSFSKSF
ncbi:MAG: GNAT family N-acetyltransferase [Desulfobacteraceae bacterium]|nr:GNAT family N-acetyltransferase [Desulfobacteraceae bacterium]